MDGADSLVARTLTRDMARKVLVLLLDPVSRETLEGAVESAEGEDVVVYVVAPARVGPLEWLATDERRAHGEAGARVLEAEWLLAGAAEIGGETGASDPVLAVTDALERFAADELLVVGTGTIDPALLRALRTLGLPVRVSGLVVGRDTLRGRAAETLRSLTSGRSTATPFVAFVAANLGLLLLAILGAAIVGLAVWLAETL